MLKLANNRIVQKIVFIPVTALALLAGFAVTPAFAAVPSEGPLSITAIYNPDGGGNFTIGWTPAASAASQSVTNYKIWFKNNSASTWLNSGVSSASSPAVVSLAALNVVANPDLATGDYVDFVVAAINADNATVNSCTISVTYCPVNSNATTSIWNPAAPFPPSELFAIPGDSSVLLSWTAPYESPAVLASSYVLSDYVIEKQVAGSNAWSIVQDGVSVATSYAVTGLTNGNTYEFRVSARNSIGTGAAATGHADPDDVNYCYCLPEIVASATPAGTNYPVNFNTDGGSSVSSGTFQSGVAFSLPAAPTKSGHSFDGWFDSVSGGSALGSTYTSSASAAITLYAHWSVIPDSSTSAAKTTSSPTTTRSISADAIAFDAGASGLSAVTKKSIKATVKKAGMTATYVVTGSAGKTSGVSDKAVNALAKKRAKLLKAYLVKLGVSKSAITIKTKVVKPGKKPKVSVKALY